MFLDEDILPVCISMAIPLTDLNDKKELANLFGNYLNATWLIGKIISPFY